MNEMSLTNQLTNLSHNSYTIIPFPYSQEYISQAVELFFKFLCLPDKVKSHIDSKVSPRHRRGELGFRKREAENDLYNDDKEFFHFHPIIFEQFKTFIEQNPQVNEFLLKANNIWQAVFEMMQQIMNIFEQSYPGCYEKIFNQDEPHLILRFLRYTWQNSGEYLAKPHYDSGSFTLALAESSPGLRIGSGPDDLKLTSHEDNQAIFFISSNYRKIIDSDNLTPAWHDVIQLDANKLGRSFSRWAVVAFIDGNNVDSISRNQVPIHSKK
jgi:hypothetical protein